MSTAIGRLKRKHFTLTQPCRPGRCINRNQRSKDISGAAVYRQRGVAVHQQLSKPKAKELMDHTAMSTRAVSTAISEAKTYLAQLYINRDQQSESISELYIKSNRTLCRKHFWTTQRVDQCGISTTISISGKAVYHQRGVAVYQQPLEIKTKAFLDHTAVPTRAVYRPRKLYINSNRERKGKHFWSTQPRLPGRCLNREQQSKNISGAAVYTSAV